MILTRFGTREWGGSLIIALILTAVFLTLAVKVSFPVGITLSIITLVTWLAIAAFFRSPNRKLPADPKVIVSPADGVIKGVEVVENHGFELFGDRPVVRIGIFLSILDVHVNRAPSRLTVKYKEYREGRYLDARNSGCAKENEAMTIGGVADIKGYKFPMAIRQVSGAIARRIMCPVDKGDMLARGSVYGMIKFGSRTELYIPAEENNFEVLVKTGNRVYAGSSGMARLRK
ncbi:MAG: phosphatidylserine decarboxylase family protein [Lentisphaerae bacterium]|nr:phosphatidylserine decarboxylase family protein [Lentisphaerota bacterium]MCP4101975.1 phosphatidylserine decarboxylase family protein [Lentisphaerota bacterium]